MLKIENSSLKKYWTLRLRYPFLDFVPYPDPGFKPDAVKSNSIWNLDAVNGRYVHLKTPLIVLQALSQSIESQSNPAPYI